MQETRDTGSIPESGRSPGGVNGKPFKYSCLKDPMDGGAWWAAVRRVANSQTQLKWLSMHVLLKNFKFGMVLFFCFSLWDFFFLLIVKLCACYWNIKNTVSVCCGGRFPLFLHSFCACPLARGLFHSSLHSFKVQSGHSPTCLSVRT